jgi:hypothetical protein
MKHFFKSYWPSVLVFLAVCWLTLSPEPTGKIHVELFAGADKMVHACMMGGLTSVIIYDLWRRERRLPGKWTMLWLAIGMVIFSTLDEWAQGAMGLGRTSDPFDLLADLTGIALAMLVAPPLLRRVRK